MPNLKDKPVKKTQGELADEIVKHLTGIPTARDVQKRTELRLASAFRDKLRLSECELDALCDAEGCPGCERRHRLIHVIETLREGKARCPRNPQQHRLSLSDASDAELVDEVLHEALGIRPLFEAQRRAKLVYRQAKRKGLDVGGPCNCTVLSRLHCAECRRYQQLLLILAFVAACDANLKWRTLTIIPKFGTSVLRTQPLGDVRKVVRRIVGTLKNLAPKISGVFVLEASVNTDLEGVESCQWHVHGVVRGMSRTEYRKIKAAFAWRNGTVRAVHSKKLKNVEKFLAYMAKPEIFSRKQFVGRNGETRTHKFPIRTSQEALLAAALRSKRIGGRVFCINMERLDRIMNAI